MGRLLRALRCRDSAWRALRYPGTAGLFAALLLAVAVVHPAASATVPRPTFGASVHLRDPSHYPANDPHYARQALPDAEPSVAIGADGTVWVAALHLQHGTALWRGHVGTSPPLFVGMPDHGTGGDDVSVAVGTGPSAPLYVAALVPLPGGTGAWHVATTACPHGQIDGEFATCVFHPHLASGRRDRPWLATAGPSTVYLSYVARADDLLSGRMTVQRSEDAGRTWRVMGDPLASLTGPGALPLHGWPGTLAVDPRTGAVAEAFVTETPGAGQPYRFNRLIVAVSGDHGQTWRARPVYQGGPTEDDAHMWPGLTADAAGRLYLVWSSGHGVFLAASSDDGAMWSPPRRVDLPLFGLRTSVMPWVAAGSASHVAVAWYGSTAGRALDPQATWRVVYAESRDGGATFGQGFASPIIHRGPVCTQGDACPWVQRQLLDNFGMALDRRSGRAVLAYSRTIEFGDYRACRQAPNCPQVYYVEEQGS